MVCGTTVCGTTVCSKFGDGTEFVHFTVYSINLESTKIISLKQSLSEDGFYD